MMVFDASEEVELIPALSRACQSQKSPAIYNITEHKKRKTRGWSYDLCSTTVALVNTWEHLIRGLLFVVGPLLAVLQSWLVSSVHNVG